MFGRVITGRDVRLAVVATLELWLPATLAHTCREAGLPSDALEVPSWHRLLDGDDLLARKIPTPAGAVTAADEPTYSRRSSGLTGTFAVAVTIVHRGAGISDEDGGFTDMVDTSDLYGGAVRTVLHQHPDLEGFAENTVLVQGGYRPLPGGDVRRSLLARYVAAMVTVPGINDSQGPRVPPADPHVPDYPPAVATELGITLDPQERT